MRLSEKTYVGGRPRNSGRSPAASRSSIAARETARAVERLREVQRGDRLADPDLPPPPGRLRAAREAMKYAVSLPPIPPELPGGHPVPPVPPVPPLPARVRVVPVPEGGVQAKSFVFVTPHGDVLKEGEEVVGQRVRAKVVKNKVAPPFRSAEFDMLHADGISFEGDILDMGMEQKLIGRTGAWFRYGELQLGQGKEKARQYLKENPKLAQEIKEKILAAGTKAGCGRFTRRNACVREGSARARDVGL